MSENLNAPNTISHKELNSLLNSAYKENHSFDSEHAEINHDQEKFKVLLNQWCQISKEVIEILERKDLVITKDIRPNQAMALGALKTHLIMAIQAKSLSEEQK